MNKQQLADALVATKTGIEMGWDADKLMKHTKAELEDLLSSDSPANDEDATELEATNGSVVPAKYREMYRKSKTASGKATLNNGDELALLLGTVDHIVTCQIADQVLNRLSGATLAQYTTEREGVPHPKTGEPMKALNNGMVRMNAGNRIRSWAKKHENPEEAMAEITVFLEMVADGQA